MSQETTNATKTTSAEVDTVVSVETLSRHMVLLQRFATLERDNIVEDEVMLLRAEQRYLHWLAYLHKRRPDNMPTPPLDVAMMWSTHMLSPLRYMEDMTRLFGKHMLKYCIPLSQLTEKEVDRDVFRIDSRSQLEWEQITGLSYTLDSTCKSPFSMKCPFCTGNISVLYDVYHSMRLHHTTFECPLCYVTLSSDTISAKLFQDAMIAFDNDSSSLPRGTWLNHTTGQVDMKAGRLDMQYLLAAAPKLIEPDEDKPLTWCAINARIDAARQTKHRGSLIKMRAPTLRLIPAAYRDNCTPCSLDLISAVKRNRRFTRRIIECLHWQKHNVLHKAVERYGKFLALMAVDKKAFLVPTLGRIVNHDDTVSDKRLNTSYLTTADSWYKQFQEPYSSEDPLKRTKLSKVLFTGPVGLPYYLYRRIQWNKTKSNTEIGACVVHHGVDKKTKKENKTTNNDTDTDNDYGDNDYDDSDTGDDNGDNRCANTNSRTSHSERDRLVIQRIDDYRLGKRAVYSNVLHIVV
ncbi:hypothetical protein BDF22DRAFT_666688 [Syncephalis plumigaleata]|nr:hypothetical protein BDF22DRAFT_666688 [Syncephalis plumigaleata]